MSKKKKRKRNQYIKNIISAYKLDHLETVRQLLTKLECCPEVLDVVKEHLNYREKQVKYRGLTLTDLVCPKCGDQIMVGEVPPCETKATGRKRYGECVSCDYYFEHFIKPS